MESSPADHRDVDTVPGTRQGSECEERPVVFLTILCHPDPSRIGERRVLAELSGSQAGQARLSRIEPTFGPVGRAGEARSLEDPRISRTPIRLSRVGEDLALDASEVPTAVEVDRQVTKDRRVLSRERLRRGVVLLLAHRVTLLLKSDPEVDPFPLEGDEMVGESFALNRLRWNIRRVADFQFAVLLLGESGTGKELAARAIHRLGPRRNHPFIGANMGAIPPEQVRAELFGASKGSYTGAEIERVGCFRRADRGTLFLDEIGEASPEVQVSLLRALETREVEPLGSDRLVPVDVRVIAATDRDLRQEMAGGNFRSPLLQRLAGFEMHLPPLRERLEDLGRLFYHFLARELAEVGESARLRAPSEAEPMFVPAPLMARLAGYPWPGNVRELHNFVRQLVVGSGGRRELTPTPALQKILESGADLGPRSPRRSRHGPRREANGSADYRHISAHEDEDIVQALETEDFVVTRAAERLGVSRSALNRWIDRSPLVRKAADLGKAELEKALAAADGDHRAVSRSSRVSLKALTERLKELGLSPPPRGEK